MSPHVRSPADLGDRLAALVSWGSAMLALVLIGSCAGCTISNTGPPAISGPSELGLTLVLQATPDVLERDGTSRAVVAILARDVYGRPIAGLSVWAGIRVHGVPQDLGRLSARNLTTDSDGRSAVSYTSPEPVLGDTRETIITIVVTASTGDARAQVPRTVDIRLVPPDVTGTVP